MIGNFVAQNGVPVAAEYALRCLPSEMALEMMRLGRLRGDPAEALAQRFPLVFQEVQAGRLQVSADCMAKTMAVMQKMMIQVNSR